MLELVAASLFLLAPPVGASTLSGRVVHDGKPVAGALVTIDAATVVSGSMIWIERPPDVGIWTRTDADGRYTLTVTGPLDEYWLRAYSPSGVSAQVTAKSGSKSVKDIIIDAPTSPSSTTITRSVRVVTDHGAAVKHALVLPTALLVHMGASWSSQIPTGAAFSDDQGVARVAVLDDQANTKYAATGVSLRIVADGAAPVEAQRVDLTTEPVTLVVGAGATVSGRLTGPDGPIADTLVDLTPQRLSNDPSFTRSRVRTNAAGEFVVTHVPVGAPMLVTTPAPCGSSLFLSPQKVKPLDENESRALGDCKVTPGRHVSGKVKLDDAGALPKGLYISLAHESAGVTRVCKLSKDGSFQFDAVPSGGPYLLTICTQNLKISKQNASYSWQRPQSLRAMITSDHDDLVVLVQKFDPNAPRNADTEILEGVPSTEPKQ